MALKTFNVDEKVYLEFSKFCKDRGVSMSKQINRFMAHFIEPTAKPEYIAKLNEIRKGKFIRVNDIDEFLGLK